MRCSGCGKNKGNVISDPDKGEYYCSNCGLVFEQMFDYSIRWYGEKGTNYSTTSFTKVYKGLGTVAGGDLPWHRGMKVTDEDKIERNFSNALPALHAVWGLWHIPSNLREECSIRYRGMIRKGITHGRNSYAMAIAAVFVLCDECGIMRNTEKLAKTFGLSHVAVLKCLKAIEKWKRGNFSETNKNTMPTNR